MGPFSPRPPKIHSYENSQTKSTTKHAKEAQQKSIFMKSNQCAELLDVVTGMVPPMPPLVDPTDPC